MPVKRAANRSVKPPPPAASSQESDSWESEDQEAAAVASAAAPAPPNKGKEVLEEGDEDKDESEEQEDDEDKGESEQEDDSDEEAPPPKKRPSSSKKRGAVHRVWSVQDEQSILEAIAARRDDQGALPRTELLMPYLMTALKGKLEKTGYSRPELKQKMKNLRSKHYRILRKGVVPTEEPESRLFAISKTIWGDHVPDAAAKPVEGRHEPRAYEEMCNLYPFIAEEVDQLEAEYPSGMFKRAFGKISDRQAQAVEERIKKKRVAEMKVVMRGDELKKEVIKAIMELLD